MSIFKREAIWMTHWLLFPIYMAVFAVICLFGGLGLFVAYVGFLMFLISKLSVILKGKFFTFGPAQGGMTSGMRGLYFAGYAGMVGGWVLAFWM